MEISSINHSSPHINVYNEIDLSNLNNYYTKITGNLPTNTKEENKIIKKINRGFISQLVKINPLFLEAVDNAVNLIGRKNSKFTNKEISDISKEFTKLNKKFEKKISKWSSLENSLKNATEEKLLYGLMAKASYHKEVKEGTIIKTGVGFFKAEKIITNKEELRAVCFVPVNPNNEGQFEVDTVRSPVLAFKGTTPSSKKNIKDDLQRIIGDRSFSLSKNEIYQALKDWSKYKPLVITGHSLGGALAQRTTAEFGGQGLIAEVYHYNSPGVGEEIVNKFKENTKNLDIPKIVDIHHHQDIIHRFGGARLPTDEHYVLDTKSHITKLAAHKLQNLNNGLENLNEDVQLNEYTLRRQSLKSRIKQCVLEIGRPIISPLLRGIVKAVFAMKKAIQGIKRFFGDYRGQQVDYIKKKIGMPEL